MVRPTKPKDIKPKAEITSVSTGGESSGTGGNKVMIINIVMTMLICTIFLSANYFMQDKLLSAKLKSTVAGQGGDSQGNEMSDSVDGEQKVERGIILDLGEFILNLGDFKAKKYLKINVALELTKLPTDPDPEAKSKGGHGEGAVDPSKELEEKFSQYKPAIRDAVISTLSSKTAEELSSTAGKELAKEQITEAVNAVFDGEREVLRVSFGNFIIQ